METIAEQMMSSPQASMTLDDKQSERIRLFKAISKFLDERVDEP